MKLDQLRTFCAVVETGGFAPAAARVHRTQPAVSQHIQALEAELGHPLYERRAGTPTPAGAILYERARALLQSTGDLERELRDFDESTVPLRIGASDTHALYFLPPYIARYRADHPGARLTLVCKPSAQIAQAVADRELDAGIVSRAPNHPDLNARPLATQRLVLITPPKHPLAAQSRTTPSALRGQDFVLLESETQTGGAIARYLVEQDVAPNTVLESGSFEVIKRYVAEGIGLAIVPQPVLTPAEQSTLGTLSLPNLPKLPIAATWRKHGYHPQALQNFLALLK